MKFSLNKRVWTTFPKVETHWFSVSQNCNNSQHVQSFRKSTTGLIKTLETALPFTCTSWTTPTDETEIVLRASQEVNVSTVDCLCREGRKKAFASGVSWRIFVTSCRWTLTVRTKSQIFYQHHGGGSRQRNGKELRRELYFQRARAVCCHARTFSRCRFFWSSGKFCIRPNRLRNAGFWKHREFLTSKKLQRNCFHFESLAKSNCW